MKDIFRICRKIDIVKFEIIFSDVFLLQYRNETELLNFF